MAEPVLTAEEWAVRGPVQLVIAALCLHGRLTWEMVDALKRAAQDAADEALGLSPDSERLWALADLLESLLPPRGGMTTVTPEELVSGMSEEQMACGAVCPGGTMRCVKTRGHPGDHMARSPDLSWWWPQCDEKKMAELALKGWANLYTRTVMREMTHGVTGGMLSGGATSGPAQPRASVTDLARHQLASLEIECNEVRDLACLITGHLIGEVSQPTPEPGENRKADCLFMDFQAAVARARLQLDVARKQLSRLAEDLGL